MIKIKTILIISFVFLLVGCRNSPKPLYYWGNYQNTQLEYLKNTNDKKALNEYEKSLKEMILKDKVAPGICSEYAMLLVKLGKKDEAKKYFFKEIQSYPESKIFVKNVMSKIYGVQQ